MAYQPNFPQYQPPPPVAPANNGRFGLGSWLGGFRGQRGMTLGRRDSAGRTLNIFGRPMYPVEPGTRMQATSVPTPPPVQPSGPPPRMGPFITDKMGRGEFNAAGQSNPYQDKGWIGLGQSTSGRTIYGDPSRAGEFSRLNYTPPDPTNEWNQQVLASARGANPNMPFVAPNAAYGRVIGYNNGLPIYAGQRATGFGYTEPVRRR